MLRKAKIICTIGRIQDKLEEVIEQFITAGMDVARISMAHYDLNNDLDKNYLEELIGTIRRVAKKSGKTVAIMGDIQGPKVRIKDFVGRLQGKNEIAVKCGEEFILTSKNQFTKNKSGASIRYEGNFKFFEDIKCNIKEKDMPIEFWFGDGRVILEALKENITSTHASCQVKVAGNLKKGKGISVKNSMISPQVYSLANYPKDQTDIKLLLQKDVDFFALSFVNNKEDVMNLQEYIRLQLKKLKLPRVQDGFPIISKIETEEGFINLDEITEESYGIMVARGDLALQTKIETIPIYQKRIIDSCLTKGKPVITATQMLLSMMNFIEPRRSEATDVANAIFDGTDALMLSEETAAPDSKFRVESIRMMAKIATETEEEIGRLSQLEYKDRIDHRHEKALTALRMERAKIEKELRNRKIINQAYQNKIIELQRREDGENIAYNACKIAFESKFSAIVILTETGGTARIISRFKPNIPVIGGVYNARIARILKLSYGVEPIIIERDDSTYPFGELKQVIGQAKKSGIVKKGRRVILVAGYPRGAPGTVTFLNISKIEE